MNPNLSDAMKYFWESKSQEEMKSINTKRGNTLKSTCIYMKGSNRSYPCKVDLVLSRLANGHLIVSSEKNRKKVKQFIGEIPELFFTK